MLLTKDVEMNITHRNKRYYLEKGYDCVVGKTKMIDVKDLNPNSHYDVDVQCVNCKKINKMRYSTYLLNINNTEIQEYYCVHCQGVKKKKLAEIKQHLNELQRGDDYYWMFKENRIKELKLYINKHNNIHNIRDNDFPLYSAIIEYDISPSNLATDAGFNLEDIMNFKPYGYYDNLDNLVNEFESYIDENGRFPNQNEMVNDMSVSNIHIYKHFENVNELKKHIRYEDDGDLIDNRGDRNKSYQELYVANFLIAYGFKDLYKREQYPFKKYDKSITYRSDFTFYLENNKELHIEVWGEDLNGNSYRFESYRKKMKIKKELYKKYSDNLILINIYPKHLSGGFKKVVNNLYKIFQPYLDIKFKDIEYNLLVSNKDFKDYELLDEVMKYSKDTEFLPTKEDLKLDEYGRTLLNIVESNYGFSYFYTKFGKKMRQKKNNYWTDSKVFQRLDYMCSKYGKILSLSEYKNIKDSELIGLHSYMEKNGGYIYFKLKYIEYCIDNDRTIPQYMVDYIDGAKSGYINGVKKSEVLKHSILINKIYLKFTEYCQAKTKQTA